ncbi:hypothetical protein L3Y34_007689 [Caenorhabditis briggsae]|uniref:Cubilin n=1 Tax=Caenorhabditis briggsae TaxID=6238 RepID=A0AAE9A747_CAEBR|nr:hypothetical protein L3Y34_007689 [Caenorhabditis briggsae]
MMALGGIHVKKKTIPIRLIQPTCWKSRQCLPDVFVVEEPTRYNELCCESCFKFSKAFSNCDAKFDDRSQEFEEVEGRQDKQRHEKAWIVGEDDEADNVRSCKPTVFKFQDFRKLNKLIDMNSCEPNKCKNGATCIPQVGPKFTCLCPPHFTGQTCEADVDECSVYNGTMAGCQNNGTCVNRRGGFDCECHSGYHGPLCQYHMSACSKTFELCGPHGHCIENILDTTISSSGEANAYKCICDWGFKVSNDKNNPTCVDVDECESNPCHPGVDCVNMPGSFVCSGCPEGYKMEGNSCVDVDECQGEVKVCSPLVKCFNTIGSYYCGDCPDGYSGSGETCSRDDVCEDNKCHELATCKPTDESYSAVGAYICYCPDGYVGDGVGEDGCVKSKSTVCQSNECFNGGKCKPTSATQYQCICEDGFSGKFCEKTSPCQSNPCLNGGSCVVVDDSAYCDCPEHFFGRTCAEEEEYCGAHFTHKTGNYSFTFPARNKTDPAICDFVFNIPAVSSAVRISFTSFDEFTQEGDTPTDCTTTDGNLTLYDGPNDSSPEFATFCGDSHSVHAPLSDMPITMTSTGAMMRFRGTQGTFSIEWETIERKCGFRTSKPEGMLSVPQNKQDIVCEWFISAPGGKVIEITIPPIVMHSKENENCDQNSLEIFDGYSTYDRHRILESCSSSLEAQTLKSTGPFLSVSFVSNMLQSVSGLETIRGFTLKYKFVDPDRTCGAEIDNVNNDFDFNGVIESPNYGSLYPPNMDCTWKINGTLGNGSYSGDMVLKLTFESFDVKSGFSANGPGVMHYRSFRRLYPIDGDVVFGRGGLSRLSAYRNMMEFGTCTNDYLKIHDGDGNMLSEGCNPRKPPNELTVTNPAAVLVFHSDAADQGKGFRVRYEMMCQKRVRGNGTIQTWNFPNGGAAGTCTYVVEAPKTHVINIRFLTVGLRVLPMSECFYAPKDLSSYENYVELSGGRSDNLFFNRRYVCARYPFVEGSWLSVSASRPLKITVASDGNPLFKGLSLEYKTTDVGCGGLFSSMTGTISSPNYPEKYLAHMHCVYQIYVSWSRAVKLTFDVFDLEVTPTKGCEYDRVEIYTSYHNETVHGDLLGKFCGSMIPPAIFSTSNTMAVVFVSDRSVAGAGWNAKFEAISRRTTCDYTMTAPSGSLVFNPDMGTKYDKCEYHIAVHDNRRILLKMENMTLPCGKSSLSFRNGPTETSPPFLSIPPEVCTPQVNYMPMIRSFSNRVTIVFKSVNTEGSFFNLTYETIASGCGGRVDGLSGVVSAPQYPLSDKKNMKCEWTVAVALGNKVRFALTALDDLSSSDASGFCPLFAANRLDFFNSARLGNLHLKRFCAKELASEPITSDDNELLIRYNQAGGFQSNKIFGFSGHFTTLCKDIVLDGISGNIQNPGYPYKVHNSQYCTWTIRVPKGNRIIVTVHEFSVSQNRFYSYQSTPCKSDMLKVDDTDLAEAQVTFQNTQHNVTNSINKFCDRAVPRTIKSRHNTMKLTYNSQSDPTNKFWLSWSTLGCSWDISSPQSLMITRDHIDTEVDEFECQIKIQAPVGKQINLNITKFDLLPVATSDCTYKTNSNFNGMALFMGSSNASGAAFQSFCSPISQQIISSHTNELFIHISDRLKDVVLMHAKIDFVDTPADKDACGGIINLERGSDRTILSPGFPSPYPLGVKCRWLVNAPPGYHIEYTIEEYHTPNYHEERQARTKFNLGNSNVTCQWYMPYNDGMLTFYVGNETNQSPFEKICDESSTPKTFEMYATRSLITFEGASNLMGQKTGQAVRDKNGVRISIRARCGGVVYAESKPQVISMYHDEEEGSCNVTIKKKDPEDSEIYIRLEEFAKVNASSLLTIEDKIDIYVGGVLKYTEMLAADTTMQEYAAEDDMILSVKHANAAHSAVIVVSTDERNCGGEVKHSQGTIYAPTRNLDKPFDCAWTVTNNDGNTVTVSILDHNLKSTPNCTDSYIEIRKNNSSGPLLKRQCDISSIDTTEFEAQTLYIFLRYRPSTSVSEDEETDVDQQDSNSRPLFKARYEKVSGGRPSNRFVSNPMIDGVETMVWTLDTADEKAGILVMFHELYIPSPSSYLRFTIAGENDDVETVGYQEVTGTMMPEEKFFETSVIRVYGKLDKNDRFSFSWYAVPLNSRNMTEAKKEKKVYDCGGDIIASYDWNSFNNPLPPGQSSGYEENMHCRWIIRRPMFTGIELKFDYLNLEDADNCNYDFVSFRLQFEELPEEEGEPDFTGASKHCTLARSNGTFHFSVNKALHIHFVSDRSRHGVGFKLNYRLTCNAFEHVRPGVFFEHTLTSPNYNLTYGPRIWNCQYTLIMETNRKIFVQIVDLDMEDRTPCDPDNSLVLGNRYSEIQPALTQYAAATKFCGRLDQGEPANFTSARGRLFIKFSSTPASRRGFKLIMKEHMTECSSGLIQVDENTPSRILQSPEFPQRIPNSVECEYVMTTPNGHRIMLTFDPDNFDMDGNGENCRDHYVEIRDGPSQFSNMIGKYCGNKPPSSIYSTNNFLYMKLHTSEYGRSKKFLATVELATCGGTTIVQENVTSHITSPNFPDPFTTPVQCQWNVRSPNTHMIDTKMDHLWLFYNQNCTMEQVIVRDGNSTATPLIGPACITRQVPEGYSRSASNQLTVQFSSNATASRGSRMYCNQKKCGFDLAVKLSKEKCGGVIDGVSGTLTPPGYPDKLLPHVKCVWDFKSKPGMIWSFKINWLAEEHYRSTGFVRTPKNNCFLDLMILEGIPPYTGAQMNKHFCKNITRIYSSTDISRITYDDSSTREHLAMYGLDEGSSNETFYAPFTVEYLAVPATKETKGCTMTVDTNRTLEFHGYAKLNGKGIGVDELCHVSIEKPINYGSVYLKLDNYKVEVSFQRDLGVCLSWGSYVKIQSTEPVPLSKTVCDITAMKENVTEMIYVNPTIDVFVAQLFRDHDPQEFNLTIEFQKCGGVITSPNRGEITSPNFGTGQKYLPGSKCRWILEAPEGQIVKVKIVEMRIMYEHHCEKDHLIVGEGRQAELNPIHRYCHNIDGEAEQKLEDRFKTIKTHGRYMTLQWVTDMKSEEAGWKLEYEFVNENDECGFHARGMSGQIRSPHFGEKDYDNDLECVWDIQVPVGYHVNLKFRDFDIETSGNCEKDQLMVSQEHSTRANSPNGDYYFLFQDEEKENPLCGVMHPLDWDSESNRIRLNFTTDSSTTAKGFRIDWEAKCGTVYRLNHGVISSPHYPEGYPNEEASCTYLISPPDQNSVIALKFSDFDLSSIKTSFGRSPCEEDYLQIIEASTDRVLYTICAGSAVPSDPMVFKGPIGLKFVTSKSFLWSLDDTETVKNKKKTRGFQLAYSISKCGDNIELREGTSYHTVVTSPAFPLPYAKDLDCVWNITTEPDRQLYVRFERMDLEAFMDCTADYVEIFDSSDIQANKTLGKFCGTMKQAPQYRIMSTGPNMLIHMKTDFNVNAGGFRVIVQSTLGEKDGCGGRLTATDSWQTLSSPQDDDGNYPNSLMCGWTISGPVDSQLRIRIDSIDTEQLEYPPGVKPDPECIDVLNIYDGQESFSPLLAGDICTSDNPPPKSLQTSHRHAFLTFSTDRDGVGRGFNISYKIENSECGGWLQATSDMKTLVYKGITKEENKEVDKGRSFQRCRFMIRGTKTEPVIVNFKQFNIPSKAEDCSDAYVEIRDVGSLQECQHPACAREPNQRKITKLCGSHVPNAHVSNTNTIQIIVSAGIVPTANHSRSMFKFEYNLLDNCNRTIDTNTIKSGRLTSPNYPQPYSENSTCFTKLQPSNQKMLMVFHELVLEEPNTATNLCEYDHLLFREEGTNGTKYCGTSLPATFVSSGKDVTMEFKSDHSLNHGGYDMSYYTVVSQRDNFIQFADSYELDGIISSIGYPNGYNKSISQVFTLRPPNSHDCSIIFSDVNVGLVKPKEECRQLAEEYIEIEVMYKGEKRSANIRDCTFSNRNPRELILSADSTDRYVKLTFRSDSKSENDGRGFKIRWACHNIGRTEAVLSN